MVFEFQNYREFLNAWIKEQRAKGQRATFQGLAQTVGVQKSYFSKILHGAAELSADQAYLVAQAMELNADEARYFELLVEHERTGLRARQEQLHRELEQMQKQFLLSSAHLSKSFSSAEGLEDYYLNPLLQVLHIGATLKSGDESAGALGQSLGVSEEMALDLLERLQELGVLKKEGDHWKDQMPGVHLKREHPLTKLNHLLVRAMSLFQIVRRPWQESYTLSVTFSGDEDARLKIQKEFQSFLKRVEAIVGAAKNERAYQLNFDLYPWL